MRAMRAMMWVFVYVFACISLFTKCEARDAGAESAVLQHVNNLRARHNAGPLAVKKEIQIFAQSWTEYLSEYGEFTHSRSQYGENLALVNNVNGNITQSLISAINLWYAEMPLYNFTRPVYSPTTGHFTALVWKGTTNVGIGCATKNRRTIVMFCFWPAGNLAGAFTNNVAPIIIQHRPVATAAELRRPAPKL